jgi:sugar lactone lactonase YvrE
VVTAPLLVCDDLHYPEGPLPLGGGECAFVEYGRSQVASVSRGGEKRVRWARPGAGPAAIARAAEEGLLWLTAYDENALLCLALDEADGRVQVKVASESVERGLRGPNDLAVDEDGGVFFSSSGRFELDAPAEGAVLYRGPEGTVRRVAEGIHYANGVALAERGHTLLVSEHFENRVLAFDVSREGALRGRRVLADLGALAPLPTGHDPKLGPDGLKACPSSGQVYVAQYGGGRVLVLDREGRLVGEIPLPLPHVTNVALEGEQLWITAFGHDAPPWRGALFLASL